MSIGSTMLLNLRFRRLGLRLVDVGGEGDCFSWQFLIIYMVIPIITYSLHKLVWSDLIWSFYWKQYWEFMYEYLRNRKHVLRVSIELYIQARVEVWENDKCGGNTSRKRVLPQLFRVLSNFHECFYNSIETRSTCFLFLLENTATRKRTTKKRLTLIIEM